MIEETNIYYNRLQYIKSKIKNNNTKNNIEYKDDNKIKSIIELDKNIISKELIGYIDKFVNSK